MRRDNKQKTQRYCALLFSALLTGTLLHGVAANNQSAAIANDDLPSWEDVQQAKADEASAAKKVAEIEGQLRSVRAAVENAQQASTAAQEKAQRAQEQFGAADQKHQALVAQSKQSLEDAQKAQKTAGTVVGQMYRSGGVNRSIGLFLERDPQKAENLLDRLALMAKVTERNTILAQEAKETANTAAALGQQAESAAKERERLYQIAEEEMHAAGEAVEAARVRQVAAEENQRVLEAQLAALKDKTATTVAGYQERLRLEEEKRRKAEEERKRRAAAEAEAARQRAQEAERGDGDSGASAPPVSSGDWGKPLADGTYSITCHYACYYGHKGLDLGASTWTPIYAASPGQVTLSGWNGGYGNVVYIDHGDGVQTRYAHMVQAPTVRYGQWVGRGEIIGYVGSTGRSTGPHLHYETRVRGTAKNPYDFMAARNIQM